jgi:hypothetical protein
MSLKDRFLGHLKIGFSGSKELRIEGPGVAKSPIRELDFTGLVISSIKIINWTLIRDEPYDRFHLIDQFARNVASRVNRTVSAPGLQPRCRRRWGRQDQSRRVWFLIVLFGAIFKFTKQKGRPERVQKWARIQHRARE